MEWVVVCLYVGVVLACLIGWSRHDNLHSIAKEIQQCRDPTLLNGFRDEDKNSRKRRREKAAAWINFDWSRAIWRGVLSAFFGAGFAAAIYIGAVAALLLLDFTSSTRVTFETLTKYSQTLFYSSVNLISNDALSLAGFQHNDYFPKQSERTVIFAYKWSSVLILAAVGGYIIQSLVSTLLTKFFPVHVYWAATDSRDTTGRRGKAENAIRFLMDFYK